MPHHSPGFSASLAHRGDPSARGCALRNAESFIGGACDDVSQCVFMKDDKPAFCFHEVAGLVGPSQCSVTCEGTCPDLAGWPTTFCAGFQNVGMGICLQKASSKNDYCNEVPGSWEVEAERFVGESGAAEATAMVCAPEAAIP